MTHARPRTEANYNSLSAAAQDKFDTLMEQADNAGPHDYPVLMGRIADLAGLPEGEIRKCACSCWCPVIFDAEHPDAHVIEYGEGYNLGRHQCPTCADRHRETT
ncbi:hypothetical protein [Streptomyces griseosporeus]|uniref:hypothetical protein n=1 Tax=Streptomyces griseosporeus TaxID=1910 RepID=UPI0036FC1DBB